MTANKGTRNIIVNPSSKENNTKNELITKKPVFYSLNRSCRAEVITERLMRGMSYKEIGRELGISAPCLQQIIFRLRKQGYNIPAKKDVKKMTRDPPKENYCEKRYYQELKRRLPKPGNLGRWQSDGEIRADVRQAKNPFSQVKITAQLNGIRPSEVKKICIDILEEKKK